MAVNRRLKKLNRIRGPYELPKLARQANKYYRRAERHWAGLAESARRCGEALNKA